MSWWDFSAHNHEYYKKRKERIKPTWCWHPLLNMQHSSSVSDNVRSHRRILQLPSCWTRCLLLSIRILKTWCQFTWPGKMTISSSINWNPPPKGKLLVLMDPFNWRKRKQISEIDMWSILFRKQTLLLVITTYKKLRSTCINWIWIYLMWHKI